VLALCYHGVVREHRQDRFRYNNTVSLTEFESQLELLARDFHPISARELLAWHEGARELPDNAVFVSFDDGYANNVLAAEVLLRYGIPCTFFISTGYIGTKRMLWPEEVVSRLLAWPQAQAPGPDGEQVDVPVDATARRALAVGWRERCKQIRWPQAQAYLERLRQTPATLEDDDELFRFMSWDEVRQLQAKGFDIGSHTVEHPILTQVGPEQLMCELRDSRQRIEAELGSVCDSIAYPNGGRADFSPQVIAAARAAGYRLGCTIIEDFIDAPGDPMAVNRLCVQGHLPVSNFEFRVSGAQRLLAL
jgi:peptidoglycan/xylan/chitin deacetylase (PgdA/CDA1 family)